MSTLTTDVQHSTENSSQDMVKQENIRHTDHKGRMKTFPTWRGHDGLLEIPRNQEQEKKFLELVNELNKVTG